WLVTRMQPEAGRILTRSVVVAMGGAVLVSLGALLPWYVVGSLLLVAVNGTAAWQGWAILAIGIAIAVSSGVILIAPRLPARIMAGLVVLVLAGATIAFASNQIRRIHDQDVSPLRQGIAQATRASPTAAQAAALKRTMDA